MNMQVVGKLEAANVGEGQDLPLGSFVTLAGVIVGRSEFQGGPPSYLVEFEGKGKTSRDWFTGADLNPDEA